MPPWPTRITSPTSNNYVQSPIGSSPLNGAEVDDNVAAHLYDVPTLRSRNSQWSINSPQARSSHGRSVSHPFPTLFGNAGARKGTDGEEGSGSSGGDGSSRRGYGKVTTPPVTSDTRDGWLTSKSPNKIGKPATKEDDLQQGNCLTCDSTVRWPKHLEVYRCTNCLMINDLRPAGKDTGKISNGKPQRLPRKPLPLTVDRTRDIAEQCVLAFLHQQADKLRGINKTVRLGGTSEARPIDAKTQIPSDRRQANGYLSPNTSAEENASNARSFPPTRSFHVPVQTPLQNRSPRSTSPDKEQAVWKQIFTPLEDYLLSSFQDTDCLNAAFTLARPIPIRISSEVSNASDRGYGKREEQTLDEDAVFEFDAKTLLLGDIGENGQWWTGERATKTPKNQKDSLPDRKPPTSRFDWISIYAWYDVILACGRDWRLLFAALPSDEKSILATHETEINDLISQARHHVQRTLLKGLETLLRRPGRPLQNPEDIRFLVILLANPLLYPRSWDQGHSRQMPISNIELSNTAEQTRSSRLQGIANGHHSGIIKRIFGMIANCPVSCHQALISWFCRVSEAQFRDLVELVGGFVSYRLARSKSRSKSEALDVTAGLIPDLSGPGGGTSAHLHAAIGATAKAPKEKKPEKEQAYRDDWQIRVAAKVMSLLFSANMYPKTTRYEPRKGSVQILPSAVRQRARKHSQLLPTNSFYNTRLDYVDLVGDFEVWESRRGKFSFCQYPMFLSIWGKIHILEYDARRQMELKARDAFFTSIMSRKAVSQYLVLKVRRDCLADDSLRSVSEVLGGGQEEIKKGLKIEFVGEEGVDAGGLRKEWFLLLTREVFDPEHGLFIYDSDSNYCYFNPFSFETSDQFFLIGVLLGLAIYNSTILDVALPPVAFRKLLASAPNYTGPSTTAIRPTTTYTLQDLAEWKPALARGLQQLLDHQGDDVQDIFCRDFVADVERYGQIIQVPLCPGGENKPVTNANRKEFVDLYIRYLLDTSIARQYEPFKRGFFTVCAGNALSLFRPEEIELLIRGSDEQLDTASLRGVAIYEHCKADDDYVGWFWEILESAEPKYQREILAFITGSDRIPAMGTTSLVIKIVCLGIDVGRFPIARTCFNVIGLWTYKSKEILEGKLWRAVKESEGFGLK